MGHPLVKYTETQVIKHPIVLGSTYLMTPINRPTGLLQKFDPKLLAILGLKRKNFRCDFMLEKPHVQIYYPILVSNTADIVEVPPPQDVDAVLQQRGRPAAPHEPVGRTHNSARLLFEKEHAQKCNRVRIKTIYKCHRLTATLLLY